MKYIGIAVLASLFLSAMVALIMAGLPYIYCRCRGFNLPKWWKYGPVVLGCNSILFSSIYLLGRTSGTLGHTIFLHLDAVGAVSAYSAIGGVGVGAYLLCKDRGSRVVQYGTGLSLIALVLGAIGLPL